VFGDEPYEGAADEVVRAYRAVFGGPHTDDAIRRRHLEAADEVGPLMAEAGQRFGQMSTGVRIDRVRFAAADRADVRFTVLLRGGQGPSFEGRAIRRGDTWIVTRDTVLSILPPGSGGAHAVLLTGPPGQHAANT
jgi:hypothetical protein